VIVSAPGKVMVAGEYAVLYGARALVAAVSRRAYSRLYSPEAHDSTEGSDRSGPIAAGSPGAFVRGPEVVLARALAESELGSVTGDMILDTSELRSDGGARKLGLGSSAAGAVATVAHVFALHGRAIETPGERRRILDLALEAHRGVAPEGSGADVAASTLGGLVEIQKGERLAARPIDGADALELLVVWTGKEARTSDFVRRVRERNSPQIERIAAEASAFTAALEARDAGRAIAAVRAHHHAMEALGIDAGVPIVEESLARIAELAEVHGGAAKPSGAGGGDVALAVFERGADIDPFRSACASAGLAVLSVTLGADGVRREERS
jgi:phosphomevalonate kinase